MAREGTIDFFSGNDVIITITVDDEVTPTPAAKDLTGATSIIFAIAKAQGGAPVLTKTLASGVTVTDAANGVFTVDLSKADTEPLSGKHKWFECRVTDNANKTATVVYGVATIQKNSITT